VELACKIVAKGFIAFCFNVPTDLYLEFLNDDEVENHYEKSSKNNGMIKMFNIFDAVVVIISLIEYGVQAGGNSGLTALRAFRLLRIFKLLKRWKSI